MPKVFHIGFGRVGTGLLCPLYQESGIEITGTDSYRNIVEELNSSGGFDVTYLGPERFDTEHVEISSIYPIDEKSHVIDGMVDSDFISIAVPEYNIKSIFDLLAHGLIERHRKGKKPVNIITCMNRIGTTEYVRNSINENIEKKMYKDKDGISYSVIQSVSHRTCPDRFSADDYNRMVMGGERLKPGMPKIAHTVKKMDIRPYEEVKMYLHNMAHFMGGSLLLNRGIRTIDQIGGESYNTTRLAMYEFILPFSAKYPDVFPLKDLVQLRDDLLMRMQNPKLKDNCSRLVNNIMHKLSRNQRLIGSVYRTLESGGSVENLLRGGIEAFRVTDKEVFGAQELRNYTEENGFDSVLKHVCGLSPHEKLYNALLETWEEL